MSSMTTQPFGTMRPAESEPSMHKMVGLSVTIGKNVKVQITNRRHIVCPGAVSLLKKMRFAFTRALGSLLPEACPRLQMAPCAWTG